MAKISIYLPDQLAERAKREFIRGQMSVVCQAALEQELDERSAGGPLALLSLAGHLRLLAERAEAMIE